MVRTALQASSKGCVLRYAFKQEIGVANKMQDELLV